MKPETIERQMIAVYAPFAMLAGMQLELFTHLAGRPKDVESLSQGMGVKASKLRPLLYSLASAGLLEEERGLFSNGPEADHFLVKGKPHYFGGGHEVLSDLWLATLQTAESIRQGKPQAKHDFGAMSDEELKAFLGGMHAAAMGTGQHLAVTYEFSRFHHLVDVGGGSGGSAIAACEVCPNLRATVAELPSIVPFSKGFIQEAGMEAKIDVIGIDLVQEPLIGRYDVALLRNLVQVLGPESAAQALQHVGQAMETGGEMYIVGYVLNADRRTPPETAAYNLVFVNLYDEGEAYTESEYRTWLEAAGFKDFQRIIQTRGYSLLRAIKE
jgi:hypothetical protein